MFSKMNEKNYNTIIKFKASKKKRENPKGKRYRKFLSSQKYGERERDKKREVRV